MSVHQVWLTFLDLVMKQSRLWKKYGKTFPIMKDYIRLVT